MMPTTLGNGVVVYNLTPHDMVFYNGESVPPTVAPTDGTLNAEIVNTLVEKGEGYVLSKVNFRPYGMGWRMLEKIREQCPDAVIVSSIVAAQAYRGEVVSPVRVRHNRLHKDSQKIVYSDRFTVFPKEIEDGSSKEE